MSIFLADTGKVRMNKARRGIYAAAISPLTAQFTLDTPKLVEYCQYLLSDGGCDGVAPLGTTGEGTSLSMRCKLRVANAFARAGIKPERVIIGTGSPSLYDTVELTKSALRSGYCNVLVLPPYYYKNAGDDGLFAFYSRLIGLVGDSRLRIYLYHFPQMSATPLSPGLVARLFKTFGQIIAGLKDSSGDFEQSRAFVEATGGVESNFDVFPSSEAFLDIGLETGCAGVISGSTNAFAQLAQGANVEDRSVQARKMELVREVRDFAQRFPLVPSMKYFEAIRTDNNDWLRVLPPLVELTPAQTKSFDAGLAELRSHQNA